MKAKTISDLHTEHIDWLIKLDFYKDELSVLLKRLEEVVSKNTSKEILASAEHFQNQFVVQKENIDELIHSIHEHESYLENRAEQNKTVQQRANDHPKMRDKVESFEKVFNELRLGFNKFLSVTM
jgi:NhaP-type Na+/H+ and K+/H+ antiporter